MKTAPNPLSRIRIVLDHTSHPGNIGAAARAMKVMGLSQLHLVQPKRFPHPDAEAMASGAQDVLQQAQVHDSLDQALAGCVMAVGLTARSREMAQECVDAREAAHRLLPLTQQADIALVFGNETYGLSNEELRKCQLMVTIPTNPEYSSLNVASAVQVMAYEMRLASLSERPSAPEQPDLARLEDVELFYHKLEETLVNIGFLDPNNPKRLMPRLRRFFSRTGLEKEELNILMGMLKHINSHNNSKVD